MRSIWIHNRPKIFLSIGPSFEDQNFAIGGSLLLLYRSDYIVGKYISMDKVIESRDYAEVPGHQSSNHSAYAE